MGFSYSAERSTRLSGFRPLGSHSQRLPVSQSRCTLAGRRSRVDCAFSEDSDAASLTLCARLGLWRWRGPGNRPSEVVCGQLFHPIVESAPGCGPLHLGEEIPLKLFHRQSRIAAFPASLGYLEAQVVNFN